MGKECRNFLGLILGEVGEALSGLSSTYVNHPMPRGLQPKVRRFWRSLLKQMGFCFRAWEVQRLAGVQPQLIQGIRRRDGIGEGQETTA